MLKGYRTWLFNAAAMVLPILSMTEVYDVIPNEYVAYYVLFVTLANMWLRKVTTTPVGQKE